MSLVNARLREDEGVSVLISFTDLSDLITEVTVNMSPMQRVREDMHLSFKYAEK
jgi:hypothetical protein